LSGDGDTSPAGGGRVFLLAALAAAIACLAAYAPGLGGPLFFDDLPNLSENTFLRMDAGRFEHWRLASFSNDAGLLHRPLSMLSFSVNNVLSGGLDPFALKATNLALHVAVAGLLYRLFLALLQAPALAGVRPEQRHWIALLGAVIWLLHPLHVSTVLYVIQRMAQLSGLFTALGLLVFARYRLRWAREGADTGEWLAAGLWLALLTLAATLCKENGALLPWLIVVIEVFLFRGTWRGREVPWLRRAGWVLLALPALLIAAQFLLDPGWLDNRYRGREFTLGERLLTQARLLWHYVSWLLLPDITAMGFYHDDIPVSKGLAAPVTTSLALLAWAAALVLGLLLHRRAPLLAFTLLFFLVAHSMESSVWPLEMVFEHRNYVPAMALCLLLGATLVRTGERIEWWSPPVAGGLVAVVLAVLLALRAGTWSDEIGLARHNVINHPDSPRANFHYGHALFKVLKDSWDTEFDEEQRRAFTVAARTHFLRMYELNPRDMAAPVMLYQMDNSFFRNLPDAPDWLGVLEALALDRRVQASDRTALGTLVNYASDAEFPQEERARVAGVLETLAERYPRKPYLYVLRHQLMAASEGVERRALLELLLAGIEARPKDPTLYPYLVRHYGTQDLAAGYRVMGQWLGRDYLGRQAALILRVFER